MRDSCRCLWGVLVFASLFGAVKHAQAETCALELKKVNTSSSDRATYLFRATSAQHFSHPIGRGIRSSQQPGTARFADVIEKEPGKYRAEYPIRGVIQLGSHRFGYVLDSSVKATDDETESGEKQRKDAKSGETGGLLSGLAKAFLGDKKTANDETFKPVPYDRLYFDRDRDGDLTDDGVIDAKSTNQFGNRNYYSTSFPRIDVPIEIDSEKLDYAFTLRVTAYGSGTYGYVSGSVNAAVYREGEITLDNKKHRIVLVDFNSNGRFDDVPEINTSIRRADNGVYATYGDRLYVDPNTDAGIWSPYDVTTAECLYDVNELVCLDGRFYEMSVSPTGDKLTLEPSDVDVGYMSNPAEDFCAVVYGKRGLLKIRSDESGKAPVPAGSWKLLKYTLDRTGFDQAGKAGAKSEPSVLDVLTKALGATGADRARRSTVVCATATMNYDAVDVGKGETVALPFGPPYRPEVDVQYRQGTNQVSLGMSLVGSAGETCTTMRINGNQPGKPTFTIKSPDGKTVAEGQFEYG